MLGAQHYRPRNNTGHDSIVNWGYLESKSVFEKGHLGFKVEICLLKSQKVFEAILQREPPWNMKIKSYFNNHGHMTKMVDMHKYGTKSLK